MLCMIWTMSWSCQWWSPTVHWTSRLYRCCPGLTRRIPTCSGWSDMTTMSIWGLQHCWLSSLADHRSDISGACSTTVQARWEIRRISTTTPTNSSPNKNIRPGAIFFRPTLLGFVLRVCQRCRWWFLLSHCLLAEICGDILWHAVRLWDIVTAWFFDCHNAILAVTGEGTALGYVSWPGSRDCERVHGRPGGGPSGPSTRVSSVSSSFFKFLDILDILSQFSALKRWSGANTSPQRISRTSPWMRCSCHE